MTLRVQVQQEDTGAHLAQRAPRLIVVVVLPTPPFWFTTAVILMRGVVVMAECPSRGWSLER
jgi:hypothetical protein